MLFASKHPENLVRIHGIIDYSWVVVGSFRRTVAQNMSIATQKWFIDHRMLLAFSPFETQKGEVNRSIFTEHLLSDPLGLMW